MPAYAIAITEDNIRGVIHSEAGMNYRLENALRWIEEKGETGWFLRDPESPFDCAFFMPEVFEEMYRFPAGRNTDLINPVVEI